MVFLSHTSGREQVLVPGLNFLGIGHVGVYLFFCLSSFLLGLGLFSKPFDSAAVKKFFIKRVLRIVPLYYFVVTTVFLIQYFSGVYDNSYLHVSGGLSGYFEHLYFYRGDGIFWSIVTEMQFYLVVPLLVYLLLKNTRLAILLFAVVAGINFILYLGKYGLDWSYISYVTPNTIGRGTFIDVFLPGVVAAYLVTKKRDWVERYQVLITRYSTIVFIGLIAMTFILICKNFLGFNRPFYEFRFFSLIYGIGFSAFIMSSYLGNPLNRIFNNRVLGYFGVVGFSFYLLHMLVFQYLNSTELADPRLKFLLSLFLVTSLSTITFHLIEKPSIKVSYWLSKKFVK